MKFTTLADWPESLIDPSGIRSNKPRTAGKTMVIDTGMGVQMFKDFLQTSAEYVDMIKIGYGSSVLYPQQLLRQKIDLARSYEVCIFPGGTFLEIAVRQNSVAPYFEHIKRLGFTGIEVSDGTIEMDRATRNLLIEKGVKNGLNVYSEYGKKLAGSKIEENDFIRCMKRDIECGSSLVIVEGRESGLDVGIFDNRGECDHQQLNNLLSSTDCPQKLMWEAPIKSQQVYLLKTLGLDSHLGNIAPSDVISLESLRRGLRSDTMN